MHPQNTHSIRQYIKTFVVMWCCLEFISLPLLSCVPEPTFEADQSDALMPFHPSRIWAPLPNSSFVRDGIHYSHNEQGLREHHLEKQPIIVGLGDSSTFGFGVEAEDNFLHQTAVCADLGLINGGVSGYSSSQSKVLLSEILSQNSNVKWVVLASLWSDLMFSEQHDDDFMEGLNRLDIHQKLMRNFIFSYSPAIRLVSRSWFTYVKPLPPPILVNKVLVGEDEGRLRRVPTNRYAQNTKEMINMVRAYGAEPIILLLPSNKSEGNLPDEATLQYRLRADKIAYEEGVELVDMEMIYEPLPEEALGTRFVDEVHPSIQGHADIASELCELIRVN